MATAGQHGYGSTFGLGSASTSFTTVTELLTAKHSGYKVSVAKFDGPGNSTAFIEKKPGMIDPGQITVTISYDKTQYNTLQTAAAARTIKWCKLTAPDGGNLIFQGFFTGLDFAVPEDDKVTDDLTLEITGAITYATS